MHLRPERLRAHAVDAAEMADALARLGRAPGPSAEPIATSVTGARHKLAEIEAALRGAAAAAEAADRAVEDTIRRIGGGR